jgi:peptidoglycan/LPS O-acetylase OafA/YrhL
VKSVVTAPFSWRWPGARPSTATLPRQRVYFRHVEGLRGLTALYVFLFHLRGTIGKHFASAEWMNATSLFAFGHYGVAVFIVISGYCLAAPVAAKPGKELDVKAFAVKRLRRIYPAYFAALVLSVLTFYYWSGAASHIVPFSHVILAFVLHALLIHNLSPLTSEYLNVPMWTVGVEVQIYVIFALLLVPIWRRYGMGAQLAVAFVIGLAPHFLFHGALDWSCPWFVGLFSLGMFAADTSARVRSMKTWRFVVLVLVLAVVLILPIVNAVEDMHTYFASFLWTDILVGAATAAFMIASVDESGKLWGVSSLLTIKPLEILGTFAYSLYLLHFVGIVVLEETLRRLGAGAEVSIVSYILLIPVVIGISYLWYRAFERPFMSRFLRSAISEAEAGTRGLGLSALTKP